jgi:hypothetical protein
MPAVSLVYDYMMFVDVPHAEATSGIRIRGQWSNYNHIGTSAYLYC